MASTVRSILVVALIFGVATLSVGPVNAVAANGPDCDRNVDGCRNAGPLDERTVAYMEHARNVFETLMSSLEV